MHNWHEGELAVHEALNLLDVNRGRERITTATMPMQHQAFFSNLSYFVCGTCDANGQPWASILCGPPGFLQAVSSTHLAFSTVVNGDDPGLQNMAGDTVQVAGLGIDLANRRRNKVFGRIQPGMLRRGNNGEDKMLQAIITTEESIGNCPKYINMRRLAYHKRSGTTQNLTLAQCAEHIAAADMIFMASRGPKDLDVNHRGGQPGFIRVDTANDVLVVYVPDYSGNQLFSTLGNIENTAVAGLTIPHYDTGDILYLTGEAANFFGKDAAKCMPGVQRLTRIKVISRRFIAQGLNLRLEGEDVAMSPYNPPIYRLSSEPGHRLPNQEANNEAILVAVKALTPTVNKYTWRLKAPVKWQPGQFGVFDFGICNEGYEHMNDQHPQLLNDSFIRSWTITSKEGDIEIMVRKSGVVSRFLANHKLEYEELSVPFLGVGGDYGGAINKAKKILFVAGGIGITPFVSLSSRLDKHADLAILFSGKPTDGKLLEEIDASQVSYLQQYDRRMTKQDFDAVPDIEEREVYCCGPPGLVKSIEGWTTKAVYAESFEF